MKKLSLLLLLFVFAIGLTGCFKKSTERALEKTIEKQTGGQAQVDIDNDQARTSFIDEATGDQVNIDTGGDLDLPAGWPDGIELYAGDIISSVTTPDGLSVMTQTDADPNQVVAWYDEQMLADNWERVAMMEIADTIMRTYEKGSQGLNLVIATADNQTTINHTYVAEY